MEIGKKKNDFVSIDKTFSNDSSSSCSLLIKCNKDSFHFVVAKQEDLKLLAIGSYFTRKSETLLELVQRAFDSQNLFSLDFAQAKLYLNGLPCSLVPSVFNDPSKNESILRANYSNFEGEVRSSFISSIAGNFIYSEPSGISDLVHKKIPYCSVENLFPTTLDALSASVFDVSKDRVHVDVSDSFFECVVFSDKELRLHNWFEIGSENDLLYHLLNICQQLNMNPETLLLEIYGHIAYEDTTYKTLSKYFANIDSGNATLNEYSILDDKLNMTPFVSLLKILPCVS